ncbi:MAG: hypothetical protein KF836_08785 [Fimbriimonadaceae bacterium]|nr:hypothetical protein [Fimbriimonadaceae bacterium]
MLKQSYLWDKLIGFGYLLFQLRLPYRALTDPEMNNELAMRLTITAFVILFPLVMTIPFILSIRWGAYLFMIIHFFTLGANRVTNQAPGPGQVVAVLLMIYCVLRLTGKVGPPLNDWKDKLTPP